jgi:uncharacterized membrane protein YbhN (UPF0104 family)
VLAFEKQLLYNDAVMKRYLRPALVIIVLAATVILFVRYFVAHPQYWQQLGQVSRWTVLWVILLNVAMLVVLVGLCDVTLRICGKRLHLKENFLLTSYSSIANFFGPLQSGPGVRAVYLKTRHKVRLRDYTLVSLLALGFFASFSALFLLVGTRPWWQTLLALFAVGIVSWQVLKLFQKRDKKPGEAHLFFHRPLVAGLIILAFLQVVITAAWYYVEIHAVNPHVSIAQAMSYAGAANFSLFVSITPDAVGIREAFLVFSQHIHHVPTATIVSANVIDRASYVIFLVLLFGLVMSLHARDKLNLTKAKKQAAASEQ